MKSMKNKLSKIRKASERNAVFVIVLLLIAMLFFPLVIADVGSFTVDTLEAVSTGGKCAFSPQTDLIFYVSSVDRWYIFYSTYNTGGADSYFKYSYTDSGDISAINNGGFVWATTISHANSADSVLLQYANWLNPMYDEVNNIGHVFFCRNTYGGSHDLWYRNFTINAGGSLTFGDTREIKDLGSGASDKIYCNAILGNDSIPVLFVWGVDDSTYFSQFYDFTNNDIYSSSYEIITIGNLPTSLSAVDLIPYPSSISDETYLVLLANAYSEESMYSAVFNFDTATNGSVNLTSGFSDNTVNSESCYDSTRPKQTYYGASYNETYACIAYEEAGANTHLVYTFLYDFDTETSSDEYLTFNFTSSTHMVYPDVTINQNEFFVFAYHENTTTYDDGIYVNEYSNGYAEPFNNSGRTLLYTIDSHNYQPDFNVGMFSNENTSEILFGFADDQAVDTVLYGYGTIEGEFGEPPEPTPDPFGSWDLWFGIAGAIIMIASLCWFAVALSKGLREAELIVERFVYTMILFVVGFCMVIIWLGQFI